MRNLSGTIILITGGTSSFGNRVARHLLEQKPAQIQIYSRDEKKRWEMQRSFPQFRCIVGDVRVLGWLAEAIRLPSGRRWGWCCPASQANRSPDGNQQI
jgi:FlaA1/EpsC-like NDP-sugar epimerase